MDLILQFTFRCLLMRLGNFSKGFFASTTYFGVFYFLSQNKMKSVIYLNFWIHLL